MNTNTLEQFTMMDEMVLSGIEGGKNNWQANVSGVLASGSAGAAIGFPICGMACGYIGAKAGITLWTVATGATGGF
ncbi:Blp family class II bacteriocin [Streptococcus halotolerans]|uniref:Blp family class II bacteriocin n=1 Tax=Streptococcus halotolerans TaxID=1814128 RepID=UPI00078855CA|nr:Blp family class II bacteriocin [Streptococcus halotolerans]